jgi:peptide/nickel transport system substrate-binding protein
VRWHDGKPLTADDVKFTYEYFLANTQGRFTTSLRPVDSIATSGTDKLSVKLKMAYPSFPIRLLADVPIMPKHVWEGVPGAKTKETLATIGSWPYKLLEATDTLYRMRANEDYFLGAPPVGELLFPVIKDANTALQALRTGENQGWTQELPPEQVQQFSQAPLKVAKGPNYASTMLQLNNELAPLNRKEVRQAIDLAIDKKRLGDTVLIGSGTVATPGFFHPQTAFHDPAVQARFDLTRAKQLLDQVGAAPGPDGVRALDGKPLAFTLLVYSNNPLRIRAAELIGGMLEDVGMDVTVRALDANTVDGQVWPEFDASKGRDYSMAMWGWSAPLQVDPARLVDLVHSDFSIGRSNIGAYKSTEADRIGNELRTAADEAKRKELARALEKTIADELPFVMLYFQDGPTPSVLKRSTVGCTRRDRASTPSCRSYRASAASSRGVSGTSLPASEPPIDMARFLSNKLAQYALVLLVTRTPTSWCRGLCPARRWRGWLARKWAICPRRTERA